MTNPLPPIVPTSSRFLADHTAAAAASSSRTELAEAGQASSSREPPRPCANTQESRLRSASPRRQNSIADTWTKLLNNLNTLTRALAKKMARDGAYASKDDVEHNATNVRCPSKDMVTIDDPWRDSAIPIHRNLHATTLHFNPPTPGAARPTYIAAQSPIPEKGAADGFFACEKFLAKALESGLGIFQFVAPSKTGEAGYISKRSIIGQLTEKINQPGGKDLLIGGRYTLKNFGPLETTYADGSVERSDKHYALEVEDTKGVGNPHPRVRIILTQAQVAFDNKVVAATDIRQASELMDELHKQAGPEHKCTMVVSHAGIGRNATVIVYREMHDRIENGTISNPEELEAALEKLVMEGRAARGPQFVHSAEQVRELASTLLQDLNLKIQTEARRPEPPTATGTVDAAVSREIFPIDNVPPPISSQTLLASEAVVAVAIKNLFKLQENPGGGSCLFHALESDSDGEHFRLSDQRVITIRNAVADVRKNHSDNSPERLSYNCTQMMQELEVRPKAGFEIPENGMVDNETYANFQRHPGVYAGDDEISQWTEVAGNQDVTVVVVDVAADTPHIKTYSSEGKSSVENINLFGGTADQIREQIIRKLSARLNTEFDPIGSSPARYRVILRQSVHFQRIVGFRNVQEQEQANLRDEEDLKAEVAAAKKLGPNPTAKDIDEFMAALASPDEKKPRWFKRQLSRAREWVNRE
jgi:hypothetical protein